MSSCKVHKYIRAKIGDAKKTIWKCVNPDCPHYIYPELAVGRKSICWVCGEIIILTKVRMMVKKPHCDTCFTRPDKAKPSKTAEAKQESAEMWSNILEQLKEV